MQLAAQQAPTGGGNAEEGGWRVYPALNVGIGRADVEFESIDSDNPQLHTTFSGDGMYWILGGGAIVFPCSTCGVFTSFTYDYGAISDLQMARSPTLQSQTPGTGTSVRRDEITYDSRRHSVRGVVGYATRYAAPYGGVRGTFRRVELNGTIELDLSGLAGPGVTSESTVVNEFEANTIEALAGIDIRIPGTRIFVRIEGSSDGDNHNAGASVLYGLGI